MKSWLIDVYKRAALIFAALFVVLSAVSLAAALPIGLWSGDDFFRETAPGVFENGKGGYVNMLRQGREAQFTYELEDGQSGRAVMEQAQDGQVSITYADGAAWRGQKQARLLLDETGMPTTFELIADQLEGEGMGEKYHLPTLLFSLYNGFVDHRGQWWRVFPAALLFALGLTLWLYPEKLAFWGSRWQYKERPQLSDLGVFAQRASAAFIMLLGGLTLFII